MISDVNNNNCKMNITDNNLVSDDINDLITYLDNIFDFNENENNYNLENHKYCDSIRDSNTITNNFVDYDLSLNKDILSYSSYDEQMATNSSSSPSNSESTSSDEDDLLDKLKNINKSKRLKSNSNSIEKHFRVLPQHFPSLMCSMFNGGDMYSLTTLIKSLFHTNAYVGCNKPGYCGFDNMKEFVEKLFIGYNIFPDATMSLKDMKIIKKNESYSLLTFKTRFIGTTSFFLLPRDSHCKSESITTLMDKKEDEITKLKSLEDALMKSGHMVSFFMKFNYSFCIDNRTKLISYGMIDFKLSSFKPILS